MVQLDGDSNGASKTCHAPPSPAGVSQLTLFTAGAVTDLAGVAPRRFFSRESFWNQPIGAEARPDARSERWIKLLETGPAVRLGDARSRYHNVWADPQTESKTLTPPADAKE